MNKFMKLFLAAVVIAAVGLLSSSCIIVVSNEGDTQVRYTWEASQQPYIYSIAASFGDVKDWYDEVWYDHYPTVGVEVSHSPRYDGSTLIPNNIYSSTMSSSQHKGQYYKILPGKYTAICTVIDPQYRDTVDIVANYEIKKYVYDDGESSTSYYEIAFDVRRFLSGNYESRPDAWWRSAQYDNPNDRPMLMKTPESGPLLNVIEEENVTYLVFRRPAKG
jgi:hypothetical protein